MKVPFIDLQRQYESIASEMGNTLLRIAKDGNYIGGPEVREFEISFSGKFSVKNCIGTGNGTDSLFLILKALGVGPGDEVITPAFSCIPSAEVITLAGAKIVFCDIDPVYYTIDPKKIPELITSRTKAVIAVHLYGQAARVDELKDICETRGLWLIEDCAQAHLTKLDNKLVGTFGVASAFSFYPTKNLGAMGDAGCILTQDDTLAEKIRRLANHGALHKDDHNIEGLNSRLDTLQASVLSVKLKHLDSWTERRRNNAKLYNQYLQDVSEIFLPLEMPDSFHSYHIFAIRTDRRDELKAYLTSKEISTLIHYPSSLPNTKAYHQLHNSEEFPISNLLQTEELSLPVFPELTEEEIRFVSEKIKDFFNVSFD